MNDPYWPWWAVILFFGSGAWCSWLLSLIRRPGRVECPNCDGSVKTGAMREHWKVCVS